MKFQLLSLLVHLIIQAPFIPRRLIKNKDGEYNLSFKVENYVLGMQTLKDFDHKLLTQIKDNIYILLLITDHILHIMKEIFSKPLDEESNVI